VRQDRAPGVNVKSYNVMMYSNIRLFSMAKNMSISVSIPIDIYVRLVEMQDIGYGTMPLSQVVSTLLRTVLMMLDKQRETVETTVSPVVDDKDVKVMKVEFYDSHVKDDENKKDKKDKKDKKTK
jgi:hypothetical protein